METGGIRRSKELDRVKHLRFALAACALAALPFAAVAEEQADKPAAAPAAEAQAQPAPAKCLEAVVNPVTGYAFCINPRGAPVESPSRASLNRPCKPRAHDDDTFTVYEHYSGCGD